MTSIDSSANSSNQVAVKNSQNNKLSKTKQALIIIGVVVAIIAAIGVVLGGMGTLTYFFPRVMIYVDIAAAIVIGVPLFAIGMVCGALHKGVGH